jgi:mono/diheme cytochrome c family protein
MTQHWKPLAASSLVVFGAFACSTNPLGATDTELELAHARAAAGSVVYERDCSACHGRRGEGLAGVPPVMGEGALPVHQRDASPAQQYTDEQRAQAANERVLLAGATRGAFRDAGDVHAFLVQHMPKIRQHDAPPTPEEYWQVTSYLLAVNGIGIPQAGVNASNAEAVPLER